MKHLALAAALLAALPVQAQDMDWRSAMEGFTAEREAAVTCAEVRKEAIDGDRDARILARAEYNLARAEMHAVLARLEAAVIEGDDEAALAVLPERLETAKALREGFCEEALAILDELDGTREVATAIIALVGVSITAAVAVWKTLRASDDLRASSILTALEDARWPDFDDI